MVDSRRSEPVRFPVQYHAAAARVKPGRAGAHEKSGLIRVSAKNVDEATVGWGGTSATAFMPFFDLACLGGGRAKN